LLTVLPEHFLASTGLGDVLAVRRLPLATPPVHIDMLWAKPAAARPGHEWLREALLEAAREGFAVNGPARPGGNGTGDMFGGDGAGGAIIDASIIEAAAHPNRTVEVVASGKASVSDSADPDAR